MGSLPTIKGNKRQIQQLFFNLIGNSLKYSKKNVRPEIYIGSSVVQAKDIIDHLPSANPYESYFLIEVSDNGIGFDQNDAYRIFQIFTRLYGNSEFHGTGVGLSIVRKVAENHGGWVWAEGRPGEGANFKVALPTASALAASKEASI